MSSSRLAFESRDVLTELSLIYARPFSPGAGWASDVSLGLHLEI